MTDHRLRQQKDGRAGTGTAQMAESPVHQREHTVGEEVLLKKFSSLYLPFEKCIEVENGGSPISGEDGRPRGAKVFE